MTVMFHEMGSRVQRFFPRLSFGYLGYRMDRTHSIMRIATTASPVSGSDVRERMDTIKLKITIKKAVGIISAAWYTYRQKEGRRLLHAMSDGYIQVSQKELVVNARNDAVAADRDYKSISSSIAEENEESDEIEESGIFS